MANESSASITFTWDCKDLSPFDTNILKSYICFTGIMSNFYYGISDETWSEILEEFLEDTHFSSGVGRWTFESSLSNGAFEKILNTFPASSKYLRLTDYFKIEDHDKENINNALDILELPPIIWTDDDTQNLLKLKYLTKYLGKICQKNLSKYTNDVIDIYSLSYTDYEPGSDYLELNGFHQFAYNSELKEYTSYTSEGEMISNPTVDDIANAEFSDYTSEDMISQFYEMYSIEKALKELPIDIYNDIHDTFQEYLNETYGEYYMTDEEEFEHSALDDFKITLSEKLSKTSITFDINTIGENI